MAKNPKPAVKKHLKSTPKKTASKGAAAKKKPSKPQRPAVKPIFKKTATKQAAVKPSKTKKSAAKALKVAAVAKKPAAKKSAPVRAVAKKATPKPPASRKEKPKIIVKQNSQSGKPASKPAAKKVAPKPEKKAAAAKPSAAAKPVAAVKPATAAKPVAAKGKPAEKKVASAKPAPATSKLTEKKPAALAPQVGKLKDAPAKPKEGVRPVGKTSPPKTGGTNRQKLIRMRAKALRPVAFTLDEVKEIAKANEKRPAAAAPVGSAPAKKAAPAAKSAEARPAAKHVAVPEPKKEPPRVLGAASLADILGFNPNAGAKPEHNDESKIDKKFIKFYRLLLDLREHVQSGLSLHTEDTLKRSSKEDSGDLSSYSQHLADAGTDTFDRDFALSLVSSEQEALFEIEEAIKRIRKGSYGMCELTGKPIAKDRLMAVPFARYSVESQAELEKTQRRSVHRGGVFSEAGTEEGAKFIEDDSDE
jgi:RNA polymerase-binding transcription factor DksA